MPIAPRSHSQRLTSQRRSHSDRQRGSAQARGYDARWQRYARRYLARHPRCVRCDAAGVLTQSTVVDHIIPHRGDRDLFWDPANHQPLCKPCHDRKTALEDGGFGRPPVPQHQEQPHG